MDYKQELIELTNGLKIVFVKSPGLYTARIKIMFKVGGEDEKIEYGLAHLLEHEIFKGTSRYNQKEISEQFSRCAAEPNASTSSEFTEFKANFPLPALKQIISLFSDMIFDSVFDAKELESEKSIIIEEIKMYKDHPAHLAFDELIAERYRTLGLGNRIAGKMELLRKATRDQLVEFKNKHYVAKNCIISVIGDYEIEEVKELINEFFVTNFNKNEKESIEKQFTPHVLPKQSIVKIDRDINQANIMMAFPAPNYVSFDRAKMFMINHVLGLTMNSRLFTKLRNELSLCYSIYSSMINYANNGLLLVEFSTTNENSKKAVETIFEIIEDIKVNGITDSEFEEAKYMSMSQFLMNDDYPSVNMRYLAYTGEILDKKAYVEKLRNLEKEDCLNCFKKYIDKNYVTISFVGKTKFFDYKLK